MIKNAAAKRDVKTYDKITLVNLDISSLVSDTADMQHGNKTIPISNDSTVSIIL